MSIKKIEINGIKFEINWNEKFEDLVYCPTYDVFGESQGAEIIDTVAGRKVVFGYLVPYFGTLMLNVAEELVYTQIWRKV